MAKLLGELSLSVAEMPPELRNALVERGHGEGEVMTMSEAFPEYTAWHLGDRSWGYDFVHLAEEFQHQAGPAAA